MKMLTSSKRSFRKQNNQLEPQSRTEHARLMRRKWSKVIILHTEISKLNHIGHIKMVTLNYLTASTAKKDLRIDKIISGKNDSNSIIVAHSSHQNHYNVRYDRCWESCIYVTNMAPIKRCNINISNTSIGCSQWTTKIDIFWVTFSHQTNVGKILQNFRSFWLFLFHRLSLNWAHTHAHEASVPHFISFFHTCTFHTLSVILCVLVPWSLLAIGSVMMIIKLHIVTVLLHAWCTLRLTFTNIIFDTSTFHSSYM